MENNVQSCNQKKGKTLQRIEHNKLYKYTLSENKNDTSGECECAKVSVV